MANQFVVVAKEILNIKQHSTNPKTISERQNLYGVTYSIGSFLFKKKHYITAKLVSHFAFTTLIQSSTSQSEIQETDNLVN